EMPDMSEFDESEMPDMSESEDGETADTDSDEASTSEGNISDSAAEESTDTDEEESSNGGETFDASDFANAQGGGFSSMSRLQKIRSHWLLILIILAILDAGSIFMLIRISRRQKRQRAEEEKARREKAAAGEIVHAQRPVKKEGKHSHYLWILALVVIVALVVLVKLFTRQTGNSGSETETTTYTETAEKGDITTVLPGTGTLEDEEAEELSLPDEVEVTEWYVSDGDTVEEGDTLAAVDQVSVMTAIASVQENITSLDEALEDCEDDAVSETITAAADGRVIKIYASEDTAVVDTMYENEALMLLSLDGYMAVSLETDAEISTGDSVDVTLSDGTIVSGKVESLTNKTVVVVISDNGPELGDTVSVTTEDGESVGEGTLYIHSELKVTGYTGTVSSVSVSEGSKVSSGDTLLKLTDTDYSDEYETLLEQRSELEGQMETLFKLYEDGYIYASCDGVISGLEKSGTSDNSSASDGEEASDDDTTADDSSADEDSSETSDTGSTDSASETGMSDTSTYSVSTLSYTGGSAVYLTSTADDANSTSGDGSSTSDDADSTSGDGSSTSDDANNTLGDGSSTADSESGDTSGNESGSTSEGSSGSSDSDTTAAATTIVKIGVVQSISGNSVTVSLLSGGSGSETVTLSTLGVYKDGSYSASGSVGSIAVGDVLILTCEDGTVSSAICISTSGTSDDSGSFSGTMDSQTGSSELADGQTDSFEITDGSSDLSSLEGQLSAGTDSSMSIDTSSITASMDTATAAESAAAESLEEEVASTYGVDETTLLAITPQDTMTLEITVDEMDILDVEAGQEATITLDAFPGQSFTGTVTSINKSGSNSGGSSKYTAVLTMDREDDMLAGMNASAKIILGTTEDVLVVPETALVEEDETTYVYTSYDEDTDTLGGKVEVSVGISDGTYAEITSGLEEGDTYCYSVLDVVNYSSSYSSSGNSAMQSIFENGGPQS
ncbi:MAG: HlyD family efflux transporter periplasmic adaptor subunit, partial [Clostridiales bacterium]|nr:HlyD family efflux transporter periplasmic adaptor subunit [Clostridiales bacterium]